VFELEPEVSAGGGELATALRGLGPVLRMRNGDLWDALGTAILRQVIRAGQSKRLYRAFCAAHGVPVELPGGECLRLFPSWEKVLTLSDEDFAGLGLAFKRRPLRAAARAFGDHAARWRELAAVALLEELQQVPGIGAWTAGAAVADWSNDWRLYPYSDLAVRTWARRAAPRYPWPDDEVRFGDLWRSLAGASMSALTVLTLAWGSQHGDIG
jgi:DNA-3-methyladenine glycosylase II